MSDFNNKITRREAIKTTGRIAIGVAAATVVGGGAYYAYIASQPKPVNLAVATWGGAWSDSTLETGKKWTAEHGDTISTELHAGSSGVVLTKLRTTWPNPLIDIVQSGASVGLRMADEGFSISMTENDFPVMKELYPQAILKHPTKGVVGLGIYMFFVGGVAWRPEFVEKDIQNWKDLLDPSLKGKIMIPPISSGDGDPVVETAYQFGGDESNVDIGFQKLKELAQTGNMGAISTTDTEAYRMFVSGEYPVALFRAGPSIAANVTRAGCECDKSMKVKMTHQFMDTPTCGITTAADMISVVDGPKKEAAKKFVNFFLNADNNTIFAKAVGVTVSNSKGQNDSALASYLPTPEQITRYGRVPDSATRAKMIDVWTDRWQKEIVPLVG